MSGVNSINWCRIVCQIVLHWYSFFKLKKNNIPFSVPTGNFGDIYAGYVAKKMGLPINKLIVATNKNDILQRVINTGEYKPDTVKATITPSMDIQVASNFERLLYYILDESDIKVGSLMSDLSSKSLFNLEKKEIDKIKKDFEAVKVTDEETMGIIDEIYKEHKFIIDPHTATGVGAAKKFRNLGDIVVLGTAHPYKFNDTIKKAIGKNLDLPKHLKLNIDKKETFDIIGNSNSEVKNYILGKIQ
jgi:Threonine synthase